MVPGDGMYEIWDSLADDPDLVESINEPHLITRTVEEFRRIYRRGGDVGREKIQWGVRTLQAREILEARENREAEPVYPSLRQAARLGSLRLLRSQGLLDSIELGDGNRSTARGPVNTRDRSRTPSRSPMTLAQ